MIKSHEVKFYRKLSLKSFKREWRWRVKAKNGNIIASSSEGYINKRDCAYNAKSTAQSIEDYFKGLQINIF